MTTRRSRFERRGVERRMQKRREEQFVESLEKARDMLNSVIEQAERGSALTLGTLEQFSDEMSEIYEQARRMDGER